MHLIWGLRSHWISEQISDLIIKSPTTLMQIYVICKQLRGHPTEYWKPRQYYDNTDGTHLSKENTAIHKMQAIKDK